jgi:hypothetical protein
MDQTRCTSWLRAVNASDLTVREAVHGVDCNHAFVHDNQTRRGVCIVDPETLATKTPSMQDWPIELHNISTSVRTLIEALGVEHCRCKRSKGALFIGASVMGHLFSAVRFEARRLLGKRCDACFAIQNGATLFLGNSKPGCAYHGRGVDIWTESMAHPTNSTITALRQACSTLDVNGSRIDRQLSRAHTVIIGWRADHYAADPHSRIGRARLAIMKEDVTRVIERAKQRGIRVVLMTESAQHFPVEKLGHGAHGGSFSEDVYQKLLRDESRCMCLHRKIPGGRLGAVGMYRRLAMAHRVPLFDFFAATLNTHQHHVASSCGFWAPRTVDGVRAPTPSVLSKKRRCCDCTHLHAPRAKP